MAIYKSRNILNGYPKAVHGDATDTQRLFVEAPLTTALVAGDTIQLCYYPYWGRIVGATIQADQLDTNGTPTLALNVGDGGWAGVDGYGNAVTVAADAQRFFTTTAVGRTNPYTTDTGSNATMNNRARLLRYSAAPPTQTLIYATVTTAAATWQAGTLRFELSYFVDEPRSLQFT